jgi:dihydrofolate reductase
VLRVVERAVEAASGKDVNIMGGADIIRQALEAGLVDELTIIVAPVVLGDGKRLFDGFSESFDLEHLGVRQSRYATFIDYRVAAVNSYGAGAMCAEVHGTAR